MSNITKNPIRVCEPSIGKEEKKWVLRVLKENRISSTGGFVELFEQEFAKKIGVKHCVAVNSGGSALFLALKVLGIGEGDEVIIPTFTMIACANAVVWTGAKPVLVDADWDTCNIDVSQIEDKITRRTKAIMPVHIYGHPCEMDKILEIARRHNLYVIEDCAEAHGAEFMGKKVGTFGDIACWSFYANKIITTGEGGAIITNDKKIAKELRKLRAYYFSEKRHFDHKKIGWNLRMSSIEAAIGLGQLEKWDKFIEARINNANYYTQNLEGIVGFSIQKLYAKNVYWMYLIRVGRHRDKLTRYLAKNGIETRTGFFPIHWQKPYKEPYKKYPIANRLGKETLYLPSGSDLTQKKQDYVIQKIKDFFS